MKQFKSIFPKAVFIAVFFFSSGNFLFAQTRPVFAEAQEADNKIRFTGSEGDMLLFEVQLKNLPATGATLNILDGNGNIIFEERISAGTHNCRYKVARNDMELVSFKVNGKSFTFSQSFTIHYKVEEKLEVKKV